MPRKRIIWIYSAIIAAVWIIVLAVPSLRYLFLAQSWKGGNVLPAIIVRPQITFTDLAQRNPQNLQLQLMALKDSKPVANASEGDLLRYWESALLSAIKGGSQPSTDNSRDENLDIYFMQENAYEQQLPSQYRRLMARFPKTSVLVVYYLNSLSTLMYPIRAAGRMADPHANENIKKDIPSPERKGTRNYTMAQWQDAINYCRRGQRLDPRNAYFDVMEAYWQFAEFHDAAGWVAIERAVQKPDFTLYKRQINQRKLQAYEIALGRPLTWEEMEGNLFSVSSGMPNSFASQMRQLTRWMTWEGAKAQMHGTNAGALKMYDLAFRVMHLWAKKTTSQMDHLTASAAESLALYGPEYAGTKPNPGATREAIHLSAFKNYAMAQHRPDLAKYVTIAKNDYDAEFTRTEIDKNLNQQFNPRALIGFILWRANVLLLLLLAGSVLAWLLSTLVIKVLFRKDAKIHHSHSSWEYWRGALSFIAWPMSVILLLGYAAGISDNIHQAVNSMAGLYYQDFMSLPVFSTGQLPPWWIPLFGIFTPFLFGLNYLLRRAAWLNRPADSPKTHWGKRFLTAIFSLTFVVVWADFSGSQSTLIFSILAVGIGIVIGIIALAIRWRGVQNRSEARGDFLQLLHGSTLRWLSLGSVLYLIFLVASIPARQPIRAYTLQKVIKGELPALLAVKKK